MPDDDIEIELCREGDPFTVILSHEGAEAFHRAMLAWARENNAPVYECEVKPRA